MSSGSSNYGYKRLTKTVDLTGRDAGGARVQDLLRHGAGVRLRVRGGPLGRRHDWKTLPDANGHTGTSVGVGCTEASDYWLSAHPHLREYIVRSTEPTTPGGDVDCEPESPGSWNAATGNSAGFQDWRDRPEQRDFAGDQSRCRSSTRPTRARSGSAPSWTTPVSPRAPTRCRTPPSRTASAAGRSRARCRAARATPTTGSGAEHRPGRRPGVRTGHSIIWGFGLEGVQGEAERSAILSNALAQWGVTD